jgi:DNA gyrase/topoisomerase IV subunit A
VSLHPLHASVLMKLSPLAVKVIRIQTKQIRAVGRATQSVRPINLENGDKICSVAKAEES